MGFGGRSGLSYIYIYTHIHTYTHTYKHTHTYLVIYTSTVYIYICKYFRTCMLSCSVVSTSILGLPFNTYQVTYVNIVIYIDIFVLFGFLNYEHVLL